MGKLITVRASSWASLFDCAYKWEGIHLLGMKNTVGLRAALGTAIHAGTATFDQSRMLGSASLDEAKGAFIDKLNDPENEYDKSKDDLTAREAEKIGSILLADYCLNVSPKHDFVAVEMETKPLDIECGGGLIVRLTGSLDRARVRKTSGGVGISDIKTGGAAVQHGEAVTKGHAAQIGTYEILFEHTTGLEITESAEIIGMKTNGKPEIKVGEISGAKSVMLGDDDGPGLIEFGADMFRTGRFYPNPKSMMCGEKYCPRWSKCKFKD